MGDGVFKLVVFMLSVGQSAWDLCCEFNELRRRPNFYFQYVREV